MHYIRESYILNFRPHYDIYMPYIIKRATHFVLYSNNRKKSKNSLDIFVIIVLLVKLCRDSFKFFFRIYKNIKSLVRSRCGYNLSPRNLHWLSLVFFTEYSLTIKQTFGMTKIVIIVIKTEKNQATIFPVQPQPLGSSNNCIHKINCT